MPVTPDDLLKLASELTGRPEESAVRAGPSRAYYAAFHRSRALRNGLLPGFDRAEGAHHALIRDFNSYTAGSPDRERRVRALGALMQQVRSLRTKADYDIHEPFRSQDAQQLLRQAETIVSRAEEIQRSIER